LAQGIVPLVHGLPSLATLCQVRQMPHDLGVEKGIVDDQQIDQFA
jgi:hypothetical protein